MYQQLNFAFKNELKKKKKDHILTENIENVQPAIDKNPSTYDLMDGIPADFKELILQKLQTRDLMTREDAEEFYDYNILGLHAGEQNAVFLDVEIIPEKIDESYIYKVKWKEVN